MAQEISEFGTLVVQTEKMVIFKKRMIRNVFVAEDGTCTIGYAKIADDGEVFETIVVPFSKFSELAENALWALIDSNKESGV